MRRKNVTSEMMKEYIVGALLCLMKSRRFSDITIGEITNKAGVNRSTYYRNFNSKEEIISLYFSHILDQSIDGICNKKDIELKEYLIHVFSCFYEHKEALLCIHRNGLSYLFLTTLNTYFEQQREVEKRKFTDEIPLYYHTGGIFNDFILWFDFNMEPAPEVFANAAASIGPANKRPVLLQGRA